MPNSGAIGAEKENTPEINFETGEGLTRTIFLLRTTDVGIIKKWAAIKETSATDIERKMIATYDFIEGEMLKGSKLLIKRTDDDQIMELTIKDNN